MHDILPDQTPLWQFVEERFQQLVAGYGYSEIRFPIVEPTELFRRSIGEVTDIVEKEMYTFEDRNGDSLTLRPEGTAGCVRACNQHGLIHNQQQRLWYRGPMFRHERPQKGRQRQFHQFGVECFGMQGPDIDAEMLAMTARLWQRLGVASAVQLQLNSIGSADCRARYREALVAYLSRYEADLDEDSRRRLHSNPLRILDSKEERTRALLDGAPDMLDYLDSPARLHFEELQLALADAGLAWQVNSRLVRGLDYYNYTVFEWITDRLGAQGTVCAGGRYDGLVEQLGGSPTAAVGFAMGVERLCLLVEEVGSMGARPGAAVDAYFVAVGEGVQRAALAMAERLRDRLPGLKLQLHGGGGNFKNQLKRADRSGARWALIMGEEEAAANEVSVKALRDPAVAQRRCGLDELARLLAPTNE